MNAADESRIDSDQDQIAIVRTNETTHVTVGNSTTILRGSFIDARDSSRLFENLCAHCAFISAKPEDRVIPDEVPPDERGTWWKNFLASEDGLRWQESQQRIYHVDVNGQGQFSASNVRPGHYELHVELDLATGGDQPAKPFGEHRGDFDVPAAESDTTPATLDLGELPLLIHTPLSPGDPLPSIQVRNHKSAPLEISFCKNDYRLLCLWWPLQDIYGAIPKNLSALNKNRGSRNDIPEVLVIVMDGQWAPAQHLLRGKKPDWPLKYVHEDDSLSLATAFGVRSSAFFLFAQDGKLVEGEIPPKMLKACLRRHSVTAA